MTGNPVRRMVSLVLAGALCMTLASCYSDGTVPGSTPSGSPEAVIPDEQMEAPAGIEAVIVVAGIDTDGLNVSASGYVTGVVEEGGTCTFTFTNTIDTLTAENPGITDARTTSCGTVQIPSESFVRGSWTVTLDYASTEVETTSEPVGLEIP